MDKEGNQLKSASLSIEITGREDVIMTDAARLLGITSPPEPLPEPLKLFISLQADAEFSGGKWTYMSTGGGVNLSGSLAPFVGKKMSTGLKVLANAIVLYRGTILSSGAVQGTVSFGGFATASQTIAGFNVSVNTRFFSNIPNQAYNFSIADLGPLATETEAGPEQGAPLAAPSYMAAPVTPSATTATQLVVTSAPNPNPVTAGSPFSLTVTAEDASGNVDTSFTGDVTVSDDGDQPISGQTSVTIPAVNGVATFSNLILDFVRSPEDLDVTASGLTSAFPTVAVVAGPATQFSLFPSAQSIPAGTPFGVTVEAMDAQGNPATSFNGNVTISDANGSGDLQGTTTEPASAGFATFSGLTLDYAGTYFLNATAPGITAPTSENPFTITAAPASQLAVWDLSGGLATGEPFTLQVAALDPVGNLDPTFDGSVTLALAKNPGGATLGGKLTATAVNGVATFTKLSISKPGSGYELQATSSGLATGIGSAFDVANDQLVVTTQPPASVAADSGFGLIVKAENGKGKVDTTFNGSVTVSDPFPGQTLDGTATVTAVKGVATFSGLSIGQAGDLTWLNVNSSGLPQVSTNTINVVPGAARQLVVSTAPGHVSTSTALESAPFEVDVAVEDAEGNVQTAYSGMVTLALASGPSGALGGTLKVAAVNGVAAFTGLTLDQAGDYTLEATTAGLTSVTTSAIDVTAPITSGGAATQLVVTTEPPSSVTAGSSFGLTVTAEDGFGTVDTSFNGTVTLSSPSGVTLGGSLTATAQNGVAVFSGLTDDLAGSGITLVATANSALNPATTSAFTVTPAAATQLVVVGPDGNAFPNTPFDVTVLAEDQFGNVNPSVGGNITLALNNPGGATWAGRSRRRSCLAWPNSRT